MDNMALINSVFSGKTVLVTGNTGFKGSWLSIWLELLGARVIGYSDEIMPGNSLFKICKLSKRGETVFADILEYEKIKSTLETFAPDFVFHLAAQAIVSEGYKEPGRTFYTNAMGTETLLRALRNAKGQKKRTVILITSDKCYENIEQYYGYRETDRLGGKDPYSASKACAEIIASSYIRSFFTEGTTSIATARAGNVIGGGDWNKDRIVPDCFRNWMAGKEVTVRSKSSTRPWQHVLEPLFGYLILASKMHVSGDFLKGENFNFGPNFENNVTVEVLVKKMFEKWCEIETPQHNGWKFCKNETLNESVLLSLDITKASTFLDWRPLLSVDECCEFTASWYSKSSKEDPLTICRNQIKQFSAKFNALRG